MRAVEFPTRNLGPTERRLVAAGSVVVLPAAATAIAVWLDLAHFGPPSLFLLAVVVAAALGGVWSGILAAAFSFVALNYFFTPPVHTFRVKEVGDLVALLVFLGVAVVVGSLFAKIVAEHEHGERREQDLRLVNRFGESLLKADLDDRVVRDVAASLTNALRLRSCDIRVDGSERLSVTVSTGAPGDDTGRDAGPSLETAISSVDTRLGVIRFERASGGEGFSSGDRVLEAVAAQLGLAIERGRSNVDARNARMGAEVSDLRAALFSSVTHDLRTPLASFKAGLTTLQDPAAELNEAGRAELVSTALEETDRLNRLVDNLLNLARARAGDVAIEKELTPFEDVVETVTARLRDLLTGFHVRAMIRPDLTGVWIDPVKMDQALTNVIENAAHHSRRGGEIQIAVAPWRGGIQVRVADHGPGIPQGERDLVFEPFFRGSGRTGAGSGLGLAIARAVVQAHGGRIRAEGAPGGGTAIVIELPRGSPPEDAAASSRPASSDDAGERP
jgi:two-component system sensor histidine kinase KdpD